MRIEKERAKRGQTENAKATTAKSTKREKRTKRDSVPTSENAGAHSLGVQGAARSAGIGGVNSLKFYVTIGDIFAPYQTLLRCMSSFTH